MIYIQFFWFFVYCNCPVDSSKYYTHQRHRYVQYLCTNLISANYLFVYCLLHLCIRMFFCNINKCGHRNVLSKRQVWISIFHIINFKKKKIMDTGVLDFFFIKKIILDYYFCLISGPVFLFQIFIIAPSLLPRDVQLYH